MQKIIIHNYTSDLSYAFTLAELAYRLYTKSLYAVNGDNAKYVWDDYAISIRVNDKSITLTVRNKGESKK